MFLVLFLIPISNLQSQKLQSETPEQKQDRLAWWTHDRFGMFIHWGLYALPARLLKKYILKDTREK